MSESTTFVAFWKYDIFPYVLSGTVRAFREDQYVEVEGYPGMAFKPILILPQDKGIDLSNKLRALDREHRESLAALNTSFKRRVKELIPFADIPL